MILCFQLISKKQRAAHFTECLSEGKPIGSVRTVDEMLGSLAPVFFALLTHGPILRRKAVQMQNKSIDDSQPTEHAEADDELVFDDIHAAIEFVAHLTMLVHDGQYDETFEDSVQCLATQDGKSKKVIPLVGFKQTHP